MKILIIGASGYLGTQLLHEFKKTAHEVHGTYSSHKQTELLKFNLQENSTWAHITNLGPDTILWVADSNDNEINKAFKNFLQQVPKKAKFVYVSSDITQCKKSLASNLPIGEYARKKQREQQLVSARPGSLVFITGPIYGTNANNVLDKRSEQLIEETASEKSYWTDVYKTFVRVDRLAQVIADAIELTGTFFVGPPEKLSFYDFYKQRVTDLDLDLKIIKSKANDALLDSIAQCRDISYGTMPNRLWV